MINNFILMKDKDADLLYNYYDNVENYFLIYIDLIKSEKNSKSNKKTFTNQLIISEYKKELNVDDFDEKEFLNEELFKKTLNFYKKNKIILFPKLNISNKTTCITFLFYYINKYSKFEFEEPYAFGDNCDKDFFEYIKKKISEKKISEIDFDKIKSGDIIIYYSKKNEFHHFGFIYNNSILSKFGLGYLKLHPINLYKEKKKIFFRINDEKYYKNFENKFMRVIKKTQIDYDDIFNEYIKVKKLYIKNKFDVNKYLKNIEKNIEDYKNKNNF